MSTKTYSCLGGPWDGREIADPDCDYFMLYDEQSPPKILHETLTDCTVEMPRTGEYRWSSVRRAFTWRGWDISA